MKDNTNIDNFELLSPPDVLKKRYPISDAVAESVSEGRETIKKILNGADSRLMVVTGPCSIHDTEAALDYAKKLVKLKAELSDTLFIVMRVYFEKPRTTVGWKGLINDPHLDGSFSIEEGIRKARQLLIDIAELGLPIATEVLDPVTPQYLQDLISWSAIGARTTESQTHREISSGLSSIVGFKNGTDGGVDVAVNAIKSAASPHRFLGVDNVGRVSIITTAGNPDTHIVLRGGSHGPNYQSSEILKCESDLDKAGIQRNIMVDVSHANSGKKAENQPKVLDDIADQIVNGNQSIFGVMIESNIKAGSQKVVNGHSELEYGVSITDECIDWETTEFSLRRIRSKLHHVLPYRTSIMHSKVC